MEGHSIFNASEFKSSDARNDPHTPSNPAAQTPAEEAESPLNSRPWSILEFSQVRIGQEVQLGGKAYSLAVLQQRGFPVPAGCVLSAPPPTDADWQKVFQWWVDVGKGPLAVRSSAVGEDSREFSFAGQQKTFLNVTTPEGLRAAVRACFESVFGSSSRAYREFFGQSQASFAMNVVLQVMVKPKFAGVFFSQDPRGQSSGWIVEAIEGLGEDLVSGQKTPLRVRQGQGALEGARLEKWKDSHSQSVVEAGIRVRDVLGYEVDMEWAIDEADRFWLLQARPVTAVHSRSRQEKEILKELRRLQSKHQRNVIWDGQTFSEWTGFPSYFTFSIWKKAFSPAGAFGKALDRLGYVGSRTTILDQNESLLERVFGRAYVNLSLLEPLFFGATPYEIVPTPRPHLEFQWKKLSFKMILRAPRGLYRMCRVAWRLQTQRRRLIGQCRKEMALFKDQMARPFDSKMYKSWSTEAIKKQLREEATAFADHYLHWPFVLIIMVESTMQSLQAAVAKAMGQKKAEATIREWMGLGLMTVTTSMSQEYQEACRVPERRPFFLARYGHRGPGELDLTNPRWSELGEKAFHAPVSGTAPKARVSVEELIGKSFGRFRAPVILQEWRFLKKMLELREHWKMELLKPYAHLRWLALELGERLGIGEDIFWYRMSEVLDERPSQNREGIDDRKQRFHVFRNLSFPVVVSLRELDDILFNKKTIAKEKVLEGDGISPGLAYGQVRVVHDPAEVDPSTWPSDVILVAEATDPGWTPLFQHVRAVIVERGGVLSHCAIVAREMGLPAVSQVRQCHYKLKEGDHVWVDGTNGRVTLG